MAQAQEIYRWVDAEGQVHFSQTPPNDASANVVQPRAPSATVSPNSLELKKFVEQRAKQREAEQMANDKQKKKAAADKEMCQKATARKTELEAKTARRLMVADEQQKLSAMTQEQFASRLKQTAELIEKHCH